MSALTNAERYKSMKCMPSADEQRTSRVEKWKSLSKSWRQNEQMKSRNISIDDGIDDLVNDIEMMDVTVDLNNNNSDNSSSQDNSVVSSIKEEWIRLLYRPHDFDQLAAALKISRLLLTKKNAHVIQDVIRAGLVPRLVELIQNEENSLLQLTVASILTDVTTENVQASLPPTSIARLAQLLKSNPCKEFKGHVITVLGNFSGDSTECRDAVLASGALPDILHFIENPPNLAMLRSSVWTVSNLCSALNSKPDENITKECVPILAELIFHDDNEVAADSCWALAYICDRSHQMRKAVIETGACKRFVELLEYRTSTSLVSAAVRALGEITTGNDEQTQAIIDCNAIPPLRSLLQFNKGCIREQVCWVLSNIGAGSTQQVQSLIDANIFPEVLKLLSNSTEDPTVEIEAGWVLQTSINKKRSPNAHIDYFVSIGVIEALCAKLTSSQVNERLLLVVLRPLRAILFITFDYDSQFLRTGALNIIKQLKTHQSPDIGRVSRDIVSYFPSSC